MTALISPHSAAHGATPARMVANYEACVDREVSEIVADALASTWPDKRANMYRSIHETLASKCRAAIVSSLPEIESRQIARYQTGSVDAELHRQLESSRAKNREIEARNATEMPRSPVPQNALECKGGVKAELREFPSRTFVCKGYQNHKLVNINVDTSASTMNVNGDDGTRNAYQIAECVVSPLDMTDDFGLHMKFIADLAIVKVGERNILISDNSGFWNYVDGPMLYRCIPSQVTWRKTRE